MMIENDEIIEILKYIIKNYIVKPDGFYYKKTGLKIGYDDRKYVRIICCGRKYYEHRLMYLIYKGDIEYNVGHADGNTRNNHIDNLVPLTFTNRAGTRTIASNNTSGYRGVSFNNQKKKYHARIMKNRKNKHIGYFDNARDAAIAFNEKALEYFGSFAYQNKI